MKISFNEFYKEATLIHLRQYKNNLEYINLK